MPEPVGPGEMDRVLELKLQSLAPMLRQLESPDASPDPAFVLALRTELAGSFGIRPDATFERRLRSQLARPSPRLARRPLWMTAGFAALGAVVVVVALVLKSGSEPRASLSAIPAPNKSDLLRTFPYLNLHPGGGGGGGFDLLASPFQPPGVAYPKKLEIQARNLRKFPGRAVAYRLHGHTLSKEADLKLARRLGIGHPAFECMPTNGTKLPDCRGRWSVVSSRSWILHNIAVGPNGQIIFSDLPQHARSPLPTRISHREATRRAKAWLRRADFHPGEVTPAPNPIVGRGAGPPGWIAVTFDWRTSNPTNIPAAQFWLDATGRVLRAEVWPPIAAKVPLRIRSVTNAWSLVASGQAPIAVEGRLATFPSGSGVQSRVSLENIVVAPSFRSAYLEPTFRFSGTVQLRGEGSHPWFALVPAAAVSP